jgi:type IV secretion system protein VirB5
MKYRLAAAAALALVLASSSGAQAAMLVYDPTSYAKLIEQAKTALDQLNQLKSQVTKAQQLFDSLNTGSGIAAIASELGMPGLREVLPDVTALAAAAKGDLKDLGAIGERADTIRAATRLYTAVTGDPRGADLEAAGERAARDLALGEAIATAGSKRLKGLESINAALDGAPNARAVLDLQARAVAEQAMIANDQMRIQGLAISQAAEQRLADQRDRERMLSELDADAAVFKRSFK